MQLDNVHSETPLPFLTSVYQRDILPDLDTQTKHLCAQRQPSSKLRHTPPMQADPHDDAHMPNRMRAATEPVEPVVLASRVEERFGEVRDVDDETKGVDSDGRNQGGC